MKHARHLARVGAGQSLMKADKLNRGLNFKFKFSGLPFPLAFRKPES